MKKFLRDKSSHIIFICVLLIQIIFMIFYCDMKKGYFVDELLSYGLSNSYYHAQIWEDGALDNPEISPDMFKEYMTVNEGEAFKFGSVIYNQTHDSHQNPADGTAHSSPKSHAAYHQNNGTCHQDQKNNLSLKAAGYRLLGCSLFSFCFFP